MPKLKFLGFLLLWPAIFSIGNAADQAQSYRIGVDDVIKVAFWQQPDLNTVARVTQEGKVSLPVIGEVQASGLATEELANSILEKISFYNRNISQASVIVVEYNSQKVFVQGQVRNPGKYTFELIPNLLDLLREAGGPTEFADLTRVAVVRGSGKDAGKTEIINLKKLQEKAELDKLPRLKTGDTVNFPKLPLGIQGDNLPAEDYQGKKVFYVYGEVARPGMLPLETPLDVLEGLVLAGGPTSSANLKKVKVIVKGVDNSQVYTLNMEEYAKQGTPQRFVLHPEDTIVIPAKKRNVLGTIWGGVRDVIPFVGAIASVILLAR